MAAYNTGIKQAGNSARTRRRGIGFWLDWAPMIGLGLTIAISGVHCIGTSLLANRAATALSLQTHGAVRHAVTAQAPERGRDIPVTGRATS